MVLLKKLVLLCASTPRGCIWNATSRPSVPTTAYSLQPHEGASGTPKRRRRDGVLPELQPHEGASGTPYGCPVEGCIEKLQPHEGASGTSLSSLGRAARPCFNPTRVHLEPRRNGPHESARSASTPRGCIWNCRRGRRDAATRPRFNPTRVHLELSGIFYGFFSRHVSGLQPHEGASGTW